MLAIALQGAGDSSRILMAVAVERNTWSTIIIQKSAVPAVLVHKNSTKRSNIENALCLVTILLGSSLSSAVCSFRGRHACSISTTEFLVSNNRQAVVVSCCDDSAYLRASGASMFFVNRFLSRTRHLSMSSSPLRVVELIDRA